MPQSARFLQQTSVNLHVIWTFHVWLKNFSALLINQLARVATALA
jgi:hypothetical protein